MTEREWKPGDVVALDASDHWTGLDRGRAAARVAAFLREIEARWGKSDIHHLTAIHGGSGTLRWLAEAFEAVSADPRPPEPQGLGAVVEDEDGRRWVYTGDQDSGGPWWYCGDEVVRWDSIAAVKVLSEGVS